MWQLWFRRRPWDWDQVLKLRPWIAWNKRECLKPSETMYFRKCCWMSKAGVMVRREWWRKGAQRDIRNKIPVGIRLPAFCQCVVLCHIREVCRLCFATARLGKVITKRDSGLHNSSQRCRDFSDDNELPMCKLTRSYWVAQSIRRYGIANLNAFPTNEGGVFKISSTKLMLASNRCTEHSVESNVASFVVFYAILFNSTVEWSITRRVVNREGTFAFALLQFTPENE